jgi:hypothetical protein
MHSAKGTTWKNHKYIKKIEDRYYYTKESLSNALNKAGSAVKETSSALKTRKQLGKLNNESYSGGSQSGPDGSEYGSVNTNHSIAYTTRADKNGNLVDVNKSAWELDQSIKNLEKEYSTTKLSELEANNKVVNKILTIVYGKSEESEDLRNWAKHHPNGQEEHVK